MERHRLTRRRFLQRAGGLAAASALGGAAYGSERLLRGRDLGPRLASFKGAAAANPRSYRSHPELHPPMVTVEGSGERGYYFLGPGASAGAQAGPLIVDDDGESVWFKPLQSDLWATNVKADRLKGEPVITWWEGTVRKPGYGKGEGVLVDSSYREVARVRAAGGRQADLHEFKLTPEGTVLLTCFPAIRDADLSSLGGSKTGKVLESIIQELDPASGRLVREWRSLDHIPIAASYRPIEEPYDYLHVNSIEVMPDGNLLISARHTWALYKLDRQTGEVIWTLGGKRSDFSMGRGAQFYWQHDARVLGDGGISLFDDGSDGATKSESQSRGVVLDVDTVGRSVALRRSYRHAQPLLASAMGNVQVLDGGNVVVGWGSEPYLTEFSADGRVVADIRLPRNQQCYRGFRLDWKATPSEPPALATVHDHAAKRSTLYVSWNGSTEVRYWRVHAGPAPHRLRPIGVAKRRGFETVIPLATRERYFAVSAFDSAARRLGRSEPVRA